MAITAVSCILCGESIGSRISTGQFRAIYTQGEEWDSACLSGIGERQQFADLIPSDPSSNITGEQTRDSEQFQLLDIWLMKNSFGTKSLAVPTAEAPIPSEPPVWGFPLHPQCWVVWESLQPRSKEHIQAIFDLCRSFPIQFNGIMSFGHDYHGSLKYVDGLFDGEEAQLGHRRGTTNETTNSNLHSIPELCQLFDNDYFIHDKGQGGTVSPVQETKAGNFSDPFKSLPNEVLIQILTEIGSIDVLHLKQASRIYAKLVLPDVFWRSRFLPGQEFEYLFPEAVQYSSRASGRWKSIFMGARQLRTLPEIKRREKIWKLAYSLETLLGLMGDVSCSGSPCRSYFEPSAAPDTFCWTTASRGLKSHRDSFTACSRVLHERILNRILGTQTIYISSIEIFGLVYISGIRFDIGGDYSSSIGYIHPRHETAICWEGEGPREPSIAGFHLAQDLRGVRGLAVLSNTGTLSGWIGDHDGIPKRRLVLGRCSHSIGGPVKMLKGGFDALKLVSLSISAGNHLDPDCNRDCEDAPSLRDTAVWSHEIPDAKLGLLGLQVSQWKYHDRQIPFSIGLFGGLNGQNLCHIVKLTVWIMEPDQFPDQFLGIGISFDRLIDGQSTLILGGDSIKGIKQSFPTARQLDFSIDSRSGERITGVDVYSLLGFYGGECGLLGFSVHTNRGRTGEFPPNASEGLRDDKFLTRSLRPDNGIILGFSIALKMGKTLEDLGIVYIELPEQELETSEDRT